MLKHEKEINSVKSQKELLEIIEKYKEHLTKDDWHLITINKYFSLEMDVDLDKLDWEYISTFMQLSIKTMEQYSGYLNWYEISCFQALTYDFILKYKDQLSLNRLERNEKISKEDIPKVQELVAKNNDEKHQKIWARNLELATTFRPLKSKSTMVPTKKEKKSKEKKRIVKTEEVKQEQNIDINKLTKQQLKEILDKNNIKYLYKDTIEILKNKVNSINKETKEQPDYSKMSKAELKKVLDEKGIKYLYKDTIDILRKKVYEN